MNLFEKIEKLQNKLSPLWVLQKFGSDGAIACFPPSHIGQTENTFNELNGIATVILTCDGFYVVKN